MENKKLKKKKLPPMKLWKAYSLCLFKPQSNSRDFTDEKNNLPSANHSAILRSLAPAPQHEIPKHDFNCVSLHLIASSL